MSGCSLYAVVVCRMERAVVTTLCVPPTNEDIQSLTELSCRVDAKNLKGEINRCCYPRCQICRGHQEATSSHSTAKAEGEQWYDDS